MASQSTSAVAPYAPQPTEAPLRWTILPNQPPGCVYFPNREEGKAHIRRKWANAYSANNNARRRTFISEGFWLVDDDNPMLAGELLKHAAGIDKTESLQTVKLPTVYGKFNGWVETHEVTCAVLSSDQKERAHAWFTDLWITTSNVYQVVWHRRAVMVHSAARNNNHVGGAVTEEEVQAVYERMQREEQASSQNLWTPWTARKEDKMLWLVDDSNPMLSQNLIMHVAGLREPPVVVTVQDHYSSDHIRCAVVHVKRSDHMLSWFKKSALAIGTSRTARWQGDEHTVYSAAINNNRPDLSVSAQEVEDVYSRVRRATERLVDMGIEGVGGCPISGTAGSSTLAQSAAVGQRMWQGMNHHPIVHIERHRA